jgi:signal peptidase II
MRYGRVFAFIIALIIAAADHLTKVIIQHSMNSFDSVPVIPGLLRIVHTENPGAAFGVLAEGNPILRSVVLIGVSSVVLCFVLSALWSRNSSYTALPTRFGLGLILGGAIGNLYDRIAHGTVTDFIEVFHGSWSFPAFNVADSAISIGAALILLEMLWSSRKRGVERTAGAQR